MEVIINGIQYIKKPELVKIPENKIGATHWAESPNKTLFYRIGDNVELWAPYTRTWISPHSVPYTLYCFDTYEDERRDIK